MFNKKGLKCFGLLLLFSIMVGLSLNVCSDVSALKYSINSFPLYQSNYPDMAGPSGQTISFSFDTSYNDDLTFSPDLFSLDSSYKYPRYLDGSLCKNRDYKTNIFSSVSPSGYHYKNIWSGEGTGFYRGFDGYSDCQRNLTQYSYDMFLGNTYNLSDGSVEKVVDIDTALFGRQTSSNTRHLSSVTLPIDFNDIYTFPANTPMTFSVGLVTGSASGFGDYSTPNVSFTAYYTDSSGTYHTYSFSSSECSIDDNYGFAVVNPDLSVSGAYSGFLVSCSFTPSTDIKHFASRMILYKTSTINPDSFLSYNSNDGLFFSASYFITDNDDTWSGINITRELTGENVSSAPGYTQLYGINNPPVCSSGDFLCQLGNLFSFTFINPFAPIFNLFSDNDSCASIPNLAGMIHSEETQVCPWFNSTTRNIVTPVLGLSSMMLVFGFAVRWLGARSGNFIEDSGGIDSGGYHFENKFRRKK